MADYVNTDVVKIVGPDKQEALVLFESLPAYVDRGWKLAAVKEQDKDVVVPKNGEGQPGTPVSPDKK